MILVLLLILAFSSTINARNLCAGIPEDHTLSITYKHHTSHLQLHPNSTHPNSRYGSRSEISRCFINQNLRGRCTVIINGNDRAYSEFEFIGYGVDRLTSVGAKFHMRPSPLDNAHIRGIMISALYKLSEQCQVNGNQVCVMDIQRFAPEWNKVGIYSTNKQQTVFCANDQDEDMHMIGGYLRNVEPLVKIYNDNASYRDQTKKKNRYLNDD